MQIKYFLLVIVALSVLLSCSANKEMSEINAAQKLEITKLQAEVNRLKLAAGMKDVELDGIMAKLDEIQNVQIKNNRVVLTNSILFASGSAKISDSGRQILDDIWDILVTVPNREILIEGHTDNVPISKKDVGTYKTNWELSAVRSIAIVHYVSQHKGANPARLGAVGYGEFRPVASNDTEEGRMLNRRVEIVIGRELK
ncbi:MAG: OmpA family protein [Candidatus Marinimicrobia bacterium]|nr:OmpA family protein [Candidatus Neomarinimicrobiota bacterium]